MGVLAPPPGEDRRLKVFQIREPTLLPLPLRLLLARDGDGDGSGSSLLMDMSPSAAPALGARDGFGGGLSSSVSCGRWEGGRERRRRQFPVRLNLNHRRCRIGCTPGRLTSIITLSSSPSGVGGGCDALSAATDRRVVRPPVAACLALGMVIESVDWDLCVE